MKVALASEVLAKLRTRPGRGGVRLSASEADLLLLMLRERAMRPDERAKLKAQVSDERRVRAAKAARVDRALTNSLNAAAGLR